MHSKEGVTQGNPLAMISFSSPSPGIFRATTPGSLSHGMLMMRGARGEFSNIMENLRDLQAGGPARGYYPEPTKIILVVAPVNLARAKEHFSGLGIRVVTGNRYLGGYIGDKESEGRWLAAKIKGCTESVEIIAWIYQKQPQSAYAGLQKSLQQEWAFMHRATPGVRGAFGPVETALKDIFVPALF